VAPLSTIQPIDVRVDEANWVVIAMCLGIASGEAECLVFVLSLRSLNGFRSTVLDIMSVSTAMRF
jgi:hypothetical protein